MGEGNRNPSPTLSFSPLSFGKKVGPPEAGPPLGGRMISAPTGMAVDTRAGVVARHEWILNIQRATTGRPYDQTSRRSVRPMSQSTDTP